MYLLLEYCQINYYLQMMPDIDNYVDELFNNAEEDDARWLGFSDSRSQRRYCQDILLSLLRYVKGTNVNMVYKEITCILLQQLLAESNVVFKDLLQFITEHYDQYYTNTGLEMDYSLSVGEIFFNLLLSIDGVKEWLLQEVLMKSSLSHLETIRTQIEGGMPAPVSY